MREKSGAALSERARSTLNHLTLTRKFASKVNNLRQAARLRRLIQNCPGRRPLKTEIKKSPVRFVTGPRPPQQCVQGYLREAKAGNPWHPRPSAHLHPRRQSPSTSSSANRLRFAPPGYWLHFTKRGDNKQPVFTAGEDRQHFLTLETRAPQGCRDSHELRDSDVGPQVGEGLAAQLPTYRSFSGSDTRKSCAAIKVRIRFQLWQADRTETSFATVSVRDQALGEISSGERGGSVLNISPCSKMRPRAFRSDGRFQFRVASMISKWKSAQ